MSAAKVKRASRKKPKAKTAAKARKAKSPARRRPGYSAAAVTASWSVVADQRKSDSQRMKALRQLPTTLCEDPQKFESVLAILRDTNQSADLRHTALQTLQAAHFSSPKFEDCRPAYLATLRSLVEDQDQHLRRRVLGILSREGDAATQRRLIDGLRDSKLALVPPEKALQLLTYDIHSDAYDVAREIAAQPPSEAAQAEALRLLSADASSAPMFESILRDKSKTPEVRRLSASALQSLAPKSLQSHARDIVQDENEDAELKAASLTALTDLGEPGSMDDKLFESVGKLQKSPSGAIKKSAKRFMNKYRR